MNTTNWNVLTGLRFRLIDGALFRDTFGVNGVAQRLCRWERRALKHRARDAARAARRGRRHGDVKPEERRERRAVQVAVVDVAFLAVPVVREDRLRRRKRLQELDRLLALLLVLFPIRLLAFFGAVLDALATAAEPELGR